VTYRRVLYWVNASNFRPFKAEYFALSGRLLKTALYQEFQNLGGQAGDTPGGRRCFTPWQSLGAGVQQHVERDLPDKIFTKDYLKKLSR